jgi:pyruvate/2-oxoglutarate dehydrogenase complex dihydrolipoamide dehydrogenase (E3) component
MNILTYDAIVIGSGQGGNPLADGLADRGWKVALVERKFLGGTCINTGCTPTKTMVASAQVAHYARNAARWGVRAGRASVDLGKVVARKNAIVKQFRAGHEKKIAARPSLTLHHGEARFVDRNTVRVGDATLESGRIFIDTGARPLIPNIPGLDKVPYLTNETVMELTEVPRHLMVLGGGYIGLEFGQMFRRFGSRVTVIARDAEILPREDTDVAAELRKALEAEGVAFVLHATTTGVTATARGITLALKGPRVPRSLAASHLLVATGRQPNTEALDLPRADVATDDKGFIQVNNRLETSTPGIWALGDVKGGPQFTHVSYNDYQVIWANLIEHQNVTVDDRLVPAAIFTDPQLGRVGLTETEARKLGRPLKIGKIPMSWVARAIERDETAGMMKLIVDAETDRILGATTLCTEGGELIQALRIAMRANLPYTALKGDIYIHPTLMEGFYTLMEGVKPT